jgi:hypothetical protein
MLTIVGAIGEFEMLTIIFVLTFIGAGVLVYRIRNERKQKPQPIRLPVEDERRRMMRRYRNRR